MYFTDQDRNKLISQIRDWNSNRLDLFEISEPNEYLEFYGVMRFFFQGDDFKYQTKCLRVSSTATTRDLIEALILKFHPDMKMLSNDKYTLYECHGVHERKLKEVEHPLVVQLNWAIDDKDGKFILKNESRRRRSTDLTSHAMLSNYGMSKSTSTLNNGYDSHTVRSQSSAVYESSNANFFTRRFSSSKKSKRKSRRDPLDNDEEAKRIADEIAGKPPESSFTRTISNPDEVLKRRRQKKLESRLEQFSGVKGDDETGGTLKIYGDSINPGIPYKTLLLSVNDTADKVLMETLEKYGLSQQDQRFYVLIQQNIPPRDNRGNKMEMLEEIILHDKDCPLGILVHCPPKRGHATFAIRRRTPKDKLPLEPRMPPFSHSKHVSISNPVTDNRNRTKDVEMDESKLLYNELTKKSDSSDFPRLVKLVIDEEGNLFDEIDEIFSLTSLIKSQTQSLPSGEVTRFIKIGSQPSSIGQTPNILLPEEYYPDIRPTHCHITAKKESSTGAVKLMLTPSLDSSVHDPQLCLVYINQIELEGAMKLNHGDIIQLGGSVVFRYEDYQMEEEPIEEEPPTPTVNNHRRSSTTSIQTYLTGDLPITVQYSSKDGKNLFSKLIKLTKDYAARGSKELFSSGNNSELIDLDSSFRLASTYMSYLLLRAGLSSSQQLPYLIDFVVQNINQVILDDYSNVEMEIFWLSNASELLHLLQCDNELRNFSANAQDVLISAIEQAFSYIQNELSQDLLVLLPAFLDENDADMNDDTEEDNTPCLDRPSVLAASDSISYPVQHLLQTLSLAHTLFYNCQVNVALTIQMFSQLFHFLNTWLFNAALGDPNLIGEYKTDPVPITQEWGCRLLRRLNRIQKWSEINGLEVAANCHLQKMYQVAELMETDKRDLNSFAEMCVSLININGTQLRYLLENCEDYELPPAWIDVVVNSAIQIHDQAFNSDSRMPSSSKDMQNLFEDMDLRLPLLLPADGYCCDRGIVSYPTELKNILKCLGGMISHQPIPPILDHTDSRWKTYLGNYENTPSVSRSGTIADQNSGSPYKTEIQKAQQLPRNYLNDSVSSQISNLDTVSPSKGDSRKSPGSRKNIAIESSKPVRNSRQFDSSDEEDSKEDTSKRYKLTLTKINSSLGLSIIAARPTKNDIYRIYIKDIIPNGAGHLCGKIVAGDQLVSVDNYPLENMSQEDAVELMKKTKSTVNLVLERGAAQKYGVLDFIMQAKNNRVAKIPPRTGEPKRQPDKTVRPSINERKVTKDEKPAKRVLTENNRPERQENVLPPLPTHERVPVRPNKLAIEDRITVRPPSQTVPKPPKVNPTQRDSVDDYNSLPVRKKPGVVNKEPAYATVKGRKPTEDITLPTKRVSTQSNSQINQSKNKKIPESSSNESDSSNSMSTSDEETEEEAAPSKSVTSHSASKSDSSNKMLTSKTNLNPLPVKSASDMNIPMTKSKLPRHPVVSSETQLNRNAPKGQFITRPTITQNSNPDISKTKLEPINFQQPLPPKKTEPQEHSSTTESFTESESESSYTESFSSDHSPKPQRKINSEPLLSPTVPEALQSSKSSSSVPKLDNIENNVKVKSKQELSPQRESFLASESSSNKLKPQKSVGQKSVESKKEPSSQLEWSLSSETPSSRSKSQHSEAPKSTESNSFKSSLKQPILPTEVPPPMPTASHPQYHPPNKLEEADWSEDPKVPAVVQPKTPTEEQIKLRRKAIEDKIKQETEDRERLHNQPASIAVSSKINGKSPVAPPPSAQNPLRDRVSVQYGRPTFKDYAKERPVSLHKPPTSVPPPESGSETESNFKMPSPPSSLSQGVVVAPMNPTVIGTHEVYQDSVMKNRQSSKPKIQPEAVENLSVREKMKLFARQNGEEDVVVRTKFSSKQRKIESGDYS